MAQFHIDTMSEGGTVTSPNGFEGSQVEEGKIIAVIPVPGAVTVQVNVDALFAADLYVDASHDGVTWIRINAAIPASGGFELLAPWPYLKMGCLGGGGAGAYATATIFWVYE